jgi:hypothetical protein
MRNPKDYAANKLKSIEPNQDAAPAGTEPKRHSSTPGPKTPEGKARSSQNATRHGLAGRVVVVPTEDLALFLKFSKDLVESLHPETELEREIAQTIADGYWRLRRVRTTEDALFALGHDEGHGDFVADHENIHAAFTAAKAFRANPQVFATLSIYEQRKEEMGRVLRMRDFNKMRHLPYSPSEDGFVYSSEEIEIEAHRRKRREQAWEAEKLGFDYEEFRKKAA